MRSSLLLLVIPAACAAPRPAPPEIAPLEVRGRFEVAYAGAIDTTPAGHLLPAEANTAPRVADDTPQVRIDVRIVQMAGADARRLLGLSGTDAKGHAAALGGGCVDADAARQALDALIDGGRASELSSPSLVAAAGRPATAASARQMPLVRGFEIRGAGARFIGDPVIEEVEAGMSIDVLVSALDADGSVQLDVAASVVDLLGEPRRITGAFDEHVEVAVQVPLACRQEIAGSARALAGEAVFLGSLLVPGTAEVLLLFVSARTADPVRG